MSADYSVAPLEGAAPARGGGGGGGGSVGKGEGAMALASGGLVGGGGRARGGGGARRGAPSVCERLWQMCTDLCAETTTVEGRSLVLDRVVAEGATGFVFMARDRRTGEVFALKRIIVQTEEQARAAREEAALHRQLGRHPYVMPLYGSSITRIPTPHVPRSSFAGAAGVPDGGEVHERVEFLFPFIEGGSLEDVLRSARPLGPFLSERQALVLARGCASALSRMHSLEPVPRAHWDVKPHNLLLGDPAPGAAGPSPGERTCWRGLDPHAVLTDLGSAQPAKIPAPDRSAALRIKDMAAALSSMPYRAPELWEPPQPAGVTEKVDIFALGALLYAAAFGYSPFEVTWGDDGHPRVVECTHLRVLNGLRLPPGEDGAAGRTSPDFRALLFDLTNPEPVLRPSAAEVVRRIDRLLLVRR
jgi:serine/threonine kinase 16